MLQVTSSVNFPPELARRELGRAMGRADVEIVVATKQFEVWYFGILLLQMFTLNASTALQCDQADNLVKETDLSKLGYEWDTIKLSQIGRSLAALADSSKWSSAADLALWCLNGVANRRPQDMDEVLNHLFFNPIGGELRYLRSTDEVWYKKYSRLKLLFFSSVSVFSSLSPSLC